MQTLYGFGAPQWPHSVSGSIGMMFGDGVLCFGEALMRTNDQSGHWGCGMIGMHLLIQLPDMHVMNQIFRQMHCRSLEYVQRVASREQWPCDNSSFASSLALSIEGSDPLALT